MTTRAFRKLLDQLVVRETTYRNTESPSTCVRGPLHGKGRGKTASASNTRLDQ